jgi:hypothetical protein
MSEKFSLFSWCSHVVSLKSKIPYRKQDISGQHLLFPQLPAHLTNLCLSLFEKSIDIKHWSFNSSIYKERKCRRHSFEWEERGSKMFSLLNRISKSHSYSFSWNSISLACYRDWYCNFEILRRIYRMKDAEKNWSTKFSEWLADRPFDY